MSRLQKLMKQARGPLQKAMAIQCPDEVRAPLHNAGMCLLLAIEAMKSHQRKESCPGAGAPERLRHVRD